MNYYEIVLLTTYLGQERDILTYQSQKNFKNGQAVIVPLRKTKATGVIVKKVSKPGFETKEIAQALYDRPILNQTLLKTASWMSDYYAASLSSVFQTMIPNGITKKRREISFSDKKITKDRKPKLMADQLKIVNDINNDKSLKPQLIFGITGSGKTEIYLNLIDQTLAKGQQVIMLVPEISLTPQTLKSFQARFGQQVTLLHSYLKETERFANWQAIFDNKKSIVVGSRSALFAPFDNLGLIIIDEEHENSYKQDKTPRYQTIAVAEKIATFSRANLILGSATPSFNSFYKAQKGSYKLHTLNKRIIQESLPSVEIIDMKNEFRAKNYSIFSDKLIESIEQVLQRKEQVLLFINRRGMSTFVSCRDCGYVANCPNCELPLTFHYHELRLVCHHCNYKENIPTICPKCQSVAIKYFGTGTQRVEQELKKKVKHTYTISRMDKDTTKKTGSHELLYNNFAQNNVDILIGTQMITKGWDLANVGLVGIISADTMINFPDYNAGERTFDLLTQVAGRTGRGRSPGQVILQTYNPTNIAIKCAAKHDFLKFYKNEIENRRELNYPPFAHLIKLMYNNPAPDTAKNKAQELVEKINGTFDRDVVSLIGPSPAFIPKLANKYRWQIILKVKTDNEPEIIKITKELRQLTNNEWSIDVDPSGII